MKKQEIIDGLTSLLERLNSEVLQAYKEKGYSYGSERYKKWQNLVIKYLDDNLPGESSRFKEKLKFLGRVGVGGESDEQSFWRNDGNRVEAYINSLLLDVQNDEYEEIRLQQLSEDTSNIESDNTSVFIVHGHDNGAKQEVARFIEHLGLTAIILHEQIDRGNTIIEKLKKHTNVGYAVILYTPCDVGKSISDDELHSRARQNVVFEHGLLIGRIGRENVFALVKGTVETPGDISGVIYTEMDAAGAWKVKLFTEMKESGYSLDPSKLIS